MLQAFIRRLSARSRYLRFFAAVAELSAAQLKRFVTVDPSTRERRLYAVEPPAGALVPMGVNDPQR